MEEGVQLGPGLSGAEPPRACPGGRGALPLKSITTSRETGPHCRPERGSLLPPPSSGSSMGLTLGARGPHVPRTPHEFSKLFLFLRENVFVFRDQEFQAWEGVGAQRGARAARPETWVHHHPLHPDAGSRRGARGRGDQGLL